MGPNPVKIPNDESCLIKSTPSKAKLGGGLLPLAVVEFWRNSKPSQLKAEG
jgi:hypothetical protein